MVSLNYTLLIQMVSFIVLVILMNKILFSPILKIMQERNDKLNNTLQEAESLSSRAEELLEEYNKKMLKAKQQALQVVNDARANALEDQRKAIAKAKEEAEKKLDELKKRIEVESKTASENLERFAQALSILIAEKILGRAIESKEASKWQR